MNDRWWFRVHSKEKMLEFALLGFWSVDDAAKWKVSFMSQADEISLNGTRGFRLLVDMSGYPPQRKEVGECHQECMAYAMKCGLTNAAHIVKDVITKMQMEHLSRGVDTVAFGHFLTRDEAQKWLDAKR